MDLLDLGRLQYVKDTPFEVLGKRKRLLPDLFSGFRRLDTPIFIWVPIVLTSTGEQSSNRIYVYGDAP